MSNLSCVDLMTPLHKPCMPPPIPQGNFHSHETFCAWAKAAQQLNLVKGCAGDRHYQSLEENGQDICAGGRVDPRILFLQSHGLPDWRGFFTYFRLESQYKIYFTFEESLTFLSLLPGYLGRELTSQLPLASGWLLLVGCPLDTLMGLFLCSQWSNAILPWTPQKESMQGASALISCSHRM